MVQEIASEFAAIQASTTPTYVVDHFGVMEIFAEDDMGYDLTVL